MVRLKEFEKAVLETIDDTTDAWDLELLDATLKRALKLVADKQYRIRQEEFRESMGGK